MDNKKIMSKLDTYIKEYAKLLKENSSLKEELEKEKIEKNKVISTVENTKKSIQEAMEKVIDANNKLRNYNEKINIIFNDLDKILEILIKEENVSIDSLKELRQGIKKIKDSLNEPTE